MFGVNHKKIRMSVQKGFDQLLEYSSMVAPGVMLGKNGELTAAFWLRGADLTSASAAERNAVSFKMNAALCNIFTNGWVIQWHAIRVPSMEYPDVEFPDAITMIMDEERKDMFNQEGSHYKTELAVVVTYTPPSRIDAKISKAVWHDEDKRVVATGTREGQIIDEFNAKCVEIGKALGLVYKIRRMGQTGAYNVHNEQLVNDELLAFINYCICGEHHPIAVPPVCMMANYLIGRHQFKANVYPQIDDKHIVMVSVDGFPTDSYNGILDGLDRLPMSYRLTHRFTFYQNEQARAKLDKIRRNWKQKERGFFSQVFNTKGGAVNEDAVRMSQETQSAMADQSSGKVTFGNYVCNMIFMSEDRDKAIYSADKAIEVLKNNGFNARIEKLNSSMAWLGTLPGHARWNIRESMLSTLNLSHLVPTVSIWTGEEEAPCPMYPPNSPPLMVTPSEGSTPFNFNLHVGDLGHTLVAGPTGAGKSTLLATIAAQFRKYPKAQIFAFDKGHSMMPLTLAAGGEHYDIMSDHGKVTFAPMTKINPDSQESLTWGAGYVADLILAQGEKLTAEDRKTIYEAVKTMASNSDPSMTTLINQIQDQRLRNILQVYSVQGELGELLDNEEDTLGKGRFQCFEMDSLMGSGMKHAVIGTLLYLFNQIENRLNGEPTLIIIDEAWVVLGDETFKPKLRAWLKELRKYNCAVIIATQSLTDLTKSGIVDVILESCPTKIFLPNAEARSEIPYELYKQFNLNDAQINLIATGIPKREYYMTTPVGSRKFRLGLGPKQLAFVGASDRESIAKIRELREQDEEKWPFAWLRELDIVN